MRTTVEIELEEGILAVIDIDYHFEQVTRFDTPKGADMIQVPVIDDFYGLLSIIELDDSVSEYLVDISNYVSQDEIYEELGRVL